MDNKAVDLFADATVKDIAADPHKYGAPTFEEYCRDPERFKSFYTEAGKLAMLDKGPNQIRNQLRKQVWVVNGIKCASPERAEALAKDENIDLRYFRVELIDVGAHMCDQYLIFEKKKEDVCSNLILPR